MWYRYFHDLKKINHKNILKYPYIVILVVMRTLRTKWHAGQSNLHVSGRSMNNLVDLVEYKIIWSDPLKGADILAYIKFEILTALYRTNLDIY